MSGAEREIVRRFDLLRQVQEAGLSRRAMHRLGLLAGGGVLAGLRPRTAAAQTTGLTALNDPILEPVSPRTRPWVVAMPVPPVLGETPLTPDGGRHQYYGRFPAQKTRQLTARAAQHSFHPDLPASTIWGYEGLFPGPTIDARYGQPLLLRVANALPSLATHKGFGIPQTVTHLHNFHTASESDGGPWDWTDPGGHKDHHYTMARAGFSVPDTIPAEFRDASGGDVRETLTTLFLHEHRPEFTAANVYKGLVAMVRLFDEKDTGDETNAAGWQLPSGPHDVPLVLADKLFNPSTGQLTFDSFETDGHLGDKVTVNGKIQPFFTVKRRKYRFRVLNGSQARFFNLVLRSGGTNRPFTLITESGNFLEAPVANLTRLEVQPAERFDIIVDFSKFAPGTEVILSNTMAMADGRGPNRSKPQNPDDVRFQLLKFKVSSEVVTDPSQVPTKFRPFPAINTAEVVQRRTFALGRSNGSWTINGEVWDPDIDHTPQSLANPRNRVRRNTAEIWTLTNSSGGWEHPFHIHFEEAQLLKVNGRTPPRRIRTDIYRLGEGGSVEMFMRFRDFPDPAFVPATPGTGGRYAMHCHNTTHEDHGMMATWNIVP